MPLSYTLRGVRGLPYPLRLERVLLLLFFWAFHPEGWREREYEQPRHPRPRHCP